MKKVLNYFALLLLGLVVGCSDDDLVEQPRKVYHSGDEIEFSAEAVAKIGNENAKDSRTAYGEVSGDKIALDWVVGDMLDIACDEAIGANLATYQIPELAASNKNVATKLERVTPGAGLQWNGSQPHHFCAVYPANEVLEKYATKETPFFHVDAKAKTAKGLMPQNYTAKDVPCSSTSGKRVYTVAPNMDFAFMVAQNTQSLADVNANEGLSLTFSPLATALEFDITAGDIGIENVGDPKEIILQRLEFVSTQQNITGSFTYDFTARKLTNTSDQNKKDDAGVLTRNLLNFHLSYDGIAPEKMVKMKEGDVCNVTVFLMPDQTIPQNTLKVKIWYRVGESLRYVTAILGRDIQYTHKYYFKNFKMPAIHTNIEGTTWFSAVENDVYLSQLSMLCAGNAFSNVKDLPWYTRQQTRSYEDLWKMGVRGFEFVTQTTGEKQIPAKTSLKDEHFVCGEIEMDGHQQIGGTTISASPTFGEAFGALARYLVDESADYKAFNKETLVLIARYHAVNDGYSPSRYVANLCNFLEEISTVGVDIPNGEAGGKINIKVPQNRFVRVKPGITAGEMKGKIAIVVRPGDDDYCKRNGVESTYEAFNGSNHPMVQKWAPYLCYVENWGSAYDRWDTRYPGYAREATWNNDGKPEIEKCLWGLSNNASDSFTAASGYGFDTRYPTQPTFNFYHKINGSPLGGYIQEWARVIPQDLNLTALPTYWDKNISKDDEKLSALTTSGYVYLWYRWPGSYDEKLEAIKDVVRKAVKVKSLHTDPMCINVLSGYFADKNHTNSYEPFKESIHVPIGVGGIDFKSIGQGNGGNYAALAANLNHFMFRYLTGQIANPDEKLEQGPWGLVVADYLGASAADFTENAGPKNEKNLHGANADDAEISSRNLLKLFIANNFAFPLLRNPDYQEQKPDAEIGSGNGDDIIIGD